MKKKLVPVIAVLFLVFIILVGIIIGKKIKQFMPSNEQQNLDTYFGISSEDEAAIELNHELVEEKALIRDGAAYLDYQYVHDYLNDRFYWDAIEMFFYIRRLRML